MGNTLSRNCAQRALFIHCDDVVSSKSFISLANVRRLCYSASVWLVIEYAICEQASHWYNRRSTATVSIAHSLAVPLSAPASGAPGVFCPAVVLPPELSPESVGKMGSLVFSAVAGGGGCDFAGVLFPFSVPSCCADGAEGPADADGLAEGEEEEGVEVEEVGEAARTSSLNSSRMSSLFFILRLIVRVLPLSECGLNKRFSLAARSLSR